MSRRQRALREAAVGVVIGAGVGCALWHWFGETPGELIAWAGLPALFCGLVFHHGEWMCG
jgi:hypothetical protein